MSKDTAARAKSREAGRDKTKGNGKRATGSSKRATGNGKRGDGHVTATVARRARAGASAAHGGSGGSGNGRAGGGLQVAAVRRFDETFAADPRNRLALNAVTAGKVQVVARNREAVVRAAQRTFSHVIKTPEITNQKQSGRCWMFAGLNVLRVEAMKALKVDQFEFSENYLQFYDKLEKANYFLETMIATADEPTDGRLISFLLQDPIQDGGQWDMFANLVRKYGVVPKTAMPDAESSGESVPMNGVLRAKLREYAAELRRRKAGGEAAGELRRRKDEMLETIYRMLAIHLGRPPREFEWQWRDKDDEFHRDGTITPREFYERYVGLRPRRLREPHQLPHRRQAVRHALHGAVPGQRRRRRAGALPQRRHGHLQEGGRGADRRRSAGVVRLRRRQDGRARPGHPRPRDVRLRAGL